MYMRFIPTEAESSRMFQGFPKELIKALTEEPLTGNFHRFGVTVKVSHCCFSSSYVVFALPEVKFLSTVRSYLHTTLYFLS